MSELRGLSLPASEPDLELLENIRRGMPLAADLSRSDLLLVYPRNPEQVVVVAQAQPRSIHSLYDADMIGKTLTRSDSPIILESWRRSWPMRAQRELMSTGAPIVQHVHPIRGRDGSLLAFLSAETSLIQVERHRGRHIAFRRAIEWVTAMCIRGELASAEGLSAFTEWDGVLYADAQRRIRYMSGIANNLYRRLGYMDDLRGWRLNQLNTHDDEMAVEAMIKHLPIERETLERSQIWVRKVLPVWPPPTLRGMAQRGITLRAGASDVGGTLIMIHDATDERRNEQELNVKNTMIQEVHHRVKNNLQTIAATLRMQARRTREPEALQAINEAITRILSVAVIHEFLSKDESQTINIRDLCQRILGQSRQVSTLPGQQITFSVEGPAIYLPSQQATTCALVINELIQNAVEHGFVTIRQGRVHIKLEDGGDFVRLEVRDDGDPLPADFELAQPSSLGLQIVRTLVQADLHGQLTLQNLDDEVVATVLFPKPTHASGTVLV
jgi:two-component sensor histidine kinase